MNMTYSSIYFGMFIIFLKVAILSSKKAMHAFYRIHSQLLFILYAIVHAITFVKLHFLIIIVIVRITIDLCMLIIYLVILLNSC